MKYHKLVSVELSSPFIELLSCSSMNCSSHNHLLDADHVASTLKKCASCCFPLKIPSKWWDGTILTFGIRSGLKQVILLLVSSHQLKYKLKSGTNNYEVRCMKRRQQFLLQDRLAHLFASKKKADFWVHVNRLIKPHSSDRSPSVDGVSMQPAIANVFPS